MLKYSVFMTLQHGSHLILIIFNVTLYIKDSQTKLVGLWPGVVGRGGNKSKENLLNIPKNLLISDHFLCSHDLEVWFSSDDIRRNMILVTYNVQRIEKHSYIEFIFMNYYYFVKEVFKWRHLYYFFTGSAKLDLEEKQNLPQMETAGNEIRCISACAHDRQLQQHNPGTVLIQFSVLFCMKLSYTFETWEIKGNRKAFSKLVKKLCPFHTIFLHTFQLFLEASMWKTWTIAWTLELHWKIVTQY